MAQQSDKKSIAAIYLSKSKDEYLTLTKSTKIKNEAVYVLFFCITIKRVKKDMLASSGLTKLHNQGT